MSEPNARWISTTDSGDRKRVAPSSGARNSTPSSLSLRSLARLKTWKPPESVRIARRQPIDRKSTRLNSSHSQISYAVFCLKKKNNKRVKPQTTRRLTCTRHALLELIMRALLHVKTEFTIRADQLVRSEDRNQNIVRSLSRVYTLL